MAVLIALAVEKSARTAVQDHPAVSAGLLVVVRDIAGGLWCLAGDGEVIPD